MNDALSRLVAASAKVKQKYGRAVDHLLLRLFEHPGLVSYIRDLQVSDNGIAELEFNELPSNVLKSVADLIGCPSEAFSYSKDRVKCSALRFDVKNLVDDGASSAAKT